MRKIVSIIAAGLAAATVSHAALADGGAKFLGNITTGGQIRSDFNQYWNQITPENGCKWGSIHNINMTTGKSTFNWDNYDKCESAYKWAMEKPGERHFKFHALIWGSQYPEALCKKKNPNITVEQTKKYIYEWFDAVAEHFPDLEYIDVVNEAIWDGSNYHSGYGKPAAGANGISTDNTACGGSYIVEALGGDRVVNNKHQYDFIVTAFKEARKRWPKAVLIYNDYNTLSWQMNEGIELVQTIIKNGAPVDAYGQQSHDCTNMSKSDFESKLTRIHNETGLPLFITEYDIGQADDNKQKNDYANQIPFMWETPWIGGITIWGYINGSTWAANTGIIEKDGRKRPAMTWLESYFAQNLAKGQNTTGLGGAVAVDPIPQTPFGQAPAAIPGKIEVENFDISGVGKDEAGNSNASYSEKDSENHGDEKDYRVDAAGVDLYKKATGIILGYTQAGEWLEYTVDVAETGTYTMFAAVASAGGSAFSLSMDGKAITETIEVPKASSGEDNYDDYNKVSATVNLTAGQHVLRLNIEKDWMDIDYITFKAGENAVDDEPIAKDTSAAIKPVVQKAQLNMVARDDYDLYTMDGAFVSRLTAYGMDAAVETVKQNGAGVAKGVYFLRSKATGNLQTVRIAK